ncbi:2-dehydropantoate 2-reductase [Brevundimonas sp. VNH65]|uniref:2-dehydropantoate 2-reductase n=1 Tax=Brevundimonas sp. VNH65 TaxID=3400917 RepID=UPI003BFE1BB4
MSQSLSIAVIGPGAIGGTVAAWLSRNAAIDDLILCARSPLDRLSVETPNGGRIEATPRVLTSPDQVEAAADWVLIATKTYDVEGAAAWLKPLMGPHSRLAVLQNGVEHVERFTPYVAPDRILPVIVDLPAEREGPGQIRHRRDGTLTVPDSETGRAFAALFQDESLKPVLTDDFLTAAWTKLALNCAGAVCALTGRPSGVVHEPGMAELMRAMAAECVVVGQALGADLPDDLPDWVVERTFASQPDSVNSLLGDRLAGRPMEWDARNAVIPRLGAPHGIAAPLNQMAATLLAALEAR